MRNGKASLCQMYSLFFFLFIFCIVYPTHSADEILPENSIAKIISSLNRVDSLAFLQEKELAALRSDQEKSRLDSSTAVKVFNNKVSASNLERKLLDSLIMHCIDTLADLRSRKDKNIGDSAAIEKKKIEGLAELANKRVSLDSLIDAMKKENLRYQHWYDACR